MESILRSSEFWVGALAILGQFGVMAGLWAQADYNAILLPALTYIVGRIISKITKAGQ